MNETLNCGHVKRFRSPWTWYVQLRFEFDQERKRTNQWIKSKMKKKKKNIELKWKRMNAV